MARKYRILGFTKRNGNMYLKKLINDNGFELAGLFEINPEDLDKAATNDCEAVIIYSGEFNDMECGFVENMKRVIRDKAMILITDDYSVEILTKAMQCGISKVLTKDMNKEEIFRSIVSEIQKENVETDSELSPGTKKSKIISVFGTKGGTGKSTVSVNLATALQEKGNSVVLIDLDLQFGDVGVFMNVPKVQTISDLIKEGSFSSSTIKRYLYKHSTGVNILCAPESPELAEIVKPEHISMIAEAIKNEFDYMVFDMSPTIDEFVLHALDISDRIYFVTNPEISTLKNAKVCLDVLETLGHSSKVKMILNKDGDSYIKKKDMESTLNREISLVIPRDSKSAVSAINRGVPLVVVSPRSKASKAILKYVEHESI